MDIQLVIEQVSHEMEQYWVDSLFMQTGISQRAIVEGGGEVYKLDPAEWARWKEKLQVITEEAIAEARAKGLPVDETLSVATSCDR